MSAEPEIVVHADREHIAQGAAARLVARLSDVQAVRGTAHLVVTGGTVGIRTLEALRDSPARDVVDWSNVDVWWGDERFVGTADTDRNVLQAREALLDHIPLTPERVHVMGSSDDFPDPEAAAAAYVLELAAAASPGSGLDAPAFDVCLLGVGPDGHIASLFPDHPGRRVTDLTAIAVRDSPKPPPLRVSLTAPVIRSSLEVWVLADGEGKSDVVARGLSGDQALPVSGALGTQRSLWLLDQGSASKL